MKKVIVAMSGGIDSSVSALILKQKGFDVIGITLRFFDDKKINCCGSNESIEKFKNICNAIGIRYYIKDARTIFKESVINNFIENYLSGKTPNPCIECNRILKFDYLYKIAKGLGANFIATGHYARIEKINNEYALLRGIDNLKDQSYFLYPIKREILPYIIFPVGKLTKKEVKQIAVKNNIPVDINKESKDICFIPEGNYKLWLKKNEYVKAKEGYIKDTNGKIVGRHNGFFNFTIGQRKNIGISLGKRCYVVDINPEENTVTVGYYEDCFYKAVKISDINWLCDEFEKFTFKAQIRYKHTPQKGKLIKINEKEYQFVFDEKQFALTKGQSCVFYHNDRVIGGGIIEDVIKGE